MTKKDDEEFAFTAMYDALVADRGMNPVPDDEVQVDIRTALSPLGGPAVRPAAKSLAETTIELPKVPAEAGETR